jgi:hypothetical protein
MPRRQIGFVIWATRADSQSFAPRAMVGVAGSLQLFIINRLRCQTPQKAHLFSLGFFAVCQTELGSELELPTVVNYYFNH